MSRDRVGLLLAILVFLALAAYQLGLPGLHYDEAFEVVPSMQILLGETPGTFRQNGISIGGQLFPLMTQDYIGAINTYAVVPFLLVFGTSVVSVRTMCICIGLLTILLTFRLGQRLGGGLAAIVSVLLLAASPSFVFWYRQGVFVTSVTATIGVAAALSWLRWWETHRTRWALLGAFLFGLGLYAKLLFLWVIVALGMSAVLITIATHRWFVRGWFKDFRQFLDDKQIRSGLVVECAACFTLGIGPFLVYNIQTGGTFQSLGANLTTSYYGTNNLDFLGNLWERLGQVISVISGNQFWYLGVTRTNHLAIAMFFLGCVAVIVAVYRHSASSSAVRALVPFLVVLFVALASCVTVSALWVTHFAILVPWVFLAIGVGVAQSARLIEGSTPRIHAILALCLLILTVATGMLEVADSLRYHQAMAVSGGLVDHSDAIYDMADWLQDTDLREGGAPVVAMDWGLAASVAFLTQGRVNPIEAFGYEWEAGDEFETRLTDFVNDPASIYLWRAPNGIIFDRSQEFRAIYHTLGKQEDIVAAFYDRSGEPVYGATVLVPQGTAENAPQPID